MVRSHKRIYVARLVAVFILDDWKANKWNKTTIVSAAALIVRAAIMMPRMLRIHGGSVCCKNHPSLTANIVHHSQ